MDDFDRLSPEDKQLFDTHVLGKPAQPWYPQPGPQTLAYKSKADILGAGGSAGGGKSSLLLGLALTRHVRSLVLRKEQRSARSLVEDFLTLVGDRGTMNQNTGIWRDVGGMRTVEFGGVKDPGDEQNYKGRPHDALLIDEGDQFPEYVIRFLQAWVRTTIPGQHCQTVITFNPPSTADGDWIVRFFGAWIDPDYPAAKRAMPGELRWYVHHNDKDVEVPGPQKVAVKNKFGKRIELQPKSRTFIPMRLTDNKYLMEGGHYLSTLQALPEPLRSQLLYGDFSVGRRDDSWQVIPSEWIRKAQSRWQPGPRAGISMNTVGADVASGGEDATAIACRYGTWIAPLTTIQGSGTDSGEKAAFHILNVWEHPAIVNVDAISWGASCYERLKDRLGHVARAINVTAATEMTDRTGKYRLQTVRNAMWWQMREILDPERGWDIALPPDEELVGDLCSPRYDVRNGIIVIEDKKHIRKRLGRSPDKGEAVCLAFWEGEGTGTQVCIAPPGSRSPMARPPSGMFLPDGFGGGDDFMVIG